MDHTRGHTTTPYEEDDTHAHNPGLQHTGGGHEEGEHKSVLKKVKAKAKKIKDTITGHSHGHDDDDDDAMVTDPDVHGASDAHGINVGKEGITGQQRTNTGAAIGGHDVPACNPGAYQVFNPTTTHYVPGQEETLGGSRIDTGTQLGPGNQPGALGHTPGIGQSSGIHTTGDLGVSHKPKLGGIIEKDSHVLKHGVDANPANYQAQVGDPIGGGGGGAARQHEGNLGERATMEEASHIPVSKPEECQTFDTSASRYVPGQEGTLGWSRTDTGRSKMSEEQSYAPKNTPVMAHTGHRHNGVLGTGEAREPGNLAEVLDRTPNPERDPHAPRDVGEKPHAENYQSKVTDQTGRGGEELGATPIMHQLGKMNIHDHSTRTSDSDVKTGEQEHLFKPSLGHDQLSPEAAIPQFDATRRSGQGQHDEREQKPESYTEKISSVASGLAHKAKEATGSITSKLGYSTSETPTNVSTLPGGYAESHDGQSKGQHDEREQKPESYTEKISSIASGLAHKAQEATGSITSKLGYSTSETPTNVSTLPGGYAESQDGQSKGLGSTAASRVQGSGTEQGTAALDKVVSVKEYLAEKLKPSEEDKALSKVITEALPLHKQKENAQGETKEAVVVKGRVTESEEVANRLGRSGETDYDGVGPGLASPGKSVMDRIMDAAGSWFNSGGEPQAEADDHTREGNERTQQSSVGESQQKQTVGEPGLQ